MAPTASAPAVSVPEVSAMEVGAPEDGRWRRVKSETIVLPLAEAKVFAAKHHALPHSPTERPLEKDRIKKIKERLGSNEAISFNWSVVHFAGQDHRMNGQHSSLSILEFEGTVLDDLVFHLDRYEAPSKEAMINLFQQHDARWSSRSKADIAGAYQGLTTADVAKCDRQKAKLAVEGVVWWRKTVEKVPVPGGDEQYELFFEKSLSPFICWVDDLLTLKTPEMKFAAVAAAMYATFSKSESAAQEFWKLVALGNNGDAAHPATVLSGDLLASKDAKNKSGGKNSKKEGLAPGEMYGKSVLAWNAFRKGTQVGALRYNKEKGFANVSE